MSQIVGTMTCECGESFVLLEGQDVASYQRGLEDHLLSHLHGSADAPRTPDRRPSDQGLPST